MHERPLEPPEPRVDNEPDADEAYDAQRQRKIDDCILALQRIWRIYPPSSAAWRIADRALYPHEEK